MCIINVFGSHPLFFYILLFPSHDLYFPTSFQPAPFSFHVFLWYMSSIRLVHRSLTSLKKMSLQPHQPLTVYEIPRNSEPLTCPSQVLMCPACGAFMHVVTAAEFKSITALPRLEFSVPYRSPPSFSSYILSASSSEMFSEPQRS